MPGCLVLFITSAPKFPLPPVHELCLPSSDAPATHDDRRWTGRDMGGGQAASSNQLQACGHVPGVVVAAPTDSSIRQQQLSESMLCCCGSSTSSCSKISLSAQLLALLSFLPSVSRTTDGRLPAYSFAPIQQVVAVPSCKASFAASPKKQQTRHHSKHQHHTHLMFHLIHH